MIRIRRANRPMDCAGVGKVLQRFVDGELDDRRSERVAEHLATCAWCDHEAHDVRELKAALARSLTPAPESVARMRALGEELAARDD